MSTEFMQSYKQNIEAYMLEAFNKDSENFPKEIKDAMAYSLFAGGKRLRPILCMCATIAVGGDVKFSYNSAYALEMVHTYSLIHDDLPGMDNDDLRRGKPTNHKMFGEALAILAGDGLLTMAFEVLCKYESGLAIQLVQTLACASGSAGMVAGQVKDILAEDRMNELSIDEMEYIHNHKTGALITASLLMGAMVAKASDEEINALREYGYNFGLAFQITDDILDIIGDEAKIGKPVGSDIKNHKVTYATLYGVEKSRQMAEDAIDKAKLAISNLTGDTRNLMELANYLLQRES